MDPKTGLYSKAAQIIRGLKQERGTADQFVGAARKLGLKDAELQHAGDLPQGPISRDELAQHFEQRLPKLNIVQYGENPEFRNPTERRRYIELQQRDTLSRHPRTPGPPLSPEEATELQRLRARGPNSVDVIQRQDEEDEGPEHTQYEGYASSGTQNYRERLLKLGNTGKNQLDKAKQNYDRAVRERDYYEPVYRNNPEHPMWQQHEQRVRDAQAALQDMQAKHRGAQNYTSSHWEDHPNVLAHIRLSDREIGENRDAVRPIMERLANMAGVGVRDLSSGAVHVGVAHGVITPEEAASVSRVMGWYTPFANKKGIGKRLLHVEELQSDWAQEGRDQGFNTGEASKAYRNYVQGLHDRFRQKLSWMGDEDAINKRMDDTRLTAMAEALGEVDQMEKFKRAQNDEMGKVPQGPYVQNTQHWTDLALKNVLREAALGNYDGIVFPTGQNQADRYGLEKQIDRLQYMPNQKRVVGYKDGKQAVMKEGVEPNDLQGMIGKDLTERLLHPDNTFEPSEGNRFHELRGDDLKMGGQGMKGYYDGIVPKSVMKLARQHDPAVQPAEPVSYYEGSNEYQGFHLPMTEDLKNGILDKGFSAFRRGGSVDGALAITRRFTKDGAGAMMRLKP